MRIKDSTKFKVPALMKDEFKGNGGSPAGICIQYEYDLSTGKILNPVVGSGGGNDRTDAVKTKNQPVEGEPVIRDLGYYSPEVFKTFENANVLFLSRLYSKTCVYQSKGENREKVNFRKIYQKMLRGNISQMETEVTLGTEYRLPVRLILRLADEQVYQKRIRERERENRKRGYKKMEEEVRIRYRFNLFITNTSKEELPVNEIFGACRLRWQIELIFKYRKSLYRVRNGREVKQNRYPCVLYAGLILIVIRLQITRKLQECIQKTDKKGNRHFLSIHKVLSTLKKHFRQIYMAMRVGKNKRKDRLLFLQQTVSQNHWLERKKKEQPDNEIIDLMI